MIYQRFVLIVLLFSVAIAGFSQEEGFPKGEMFQEEVTTQPELSYRVYFPNSIKDKPTAVLIIFDPSGYATNAVNLFQDAAERCQTVIFCCDQSRNGSYQRNLTIFEAMYADIQAKFEVEQLPKFLAGFSGGSRLATAVAVLHPEMNGVIACGAGFPNLADYMPTEKAKFGYFGIVGRKDMNYSEMVKVEQRLQELEIDRHFLYTEAGHTWPGAEIHAQALTWELARLEEQEELGTEYFKEEWFGHVQTQLDSLDFYGNLLDYYNTGSAIKEVFGESANGLNFKTVDEIGFKKAQENRAALIEMEIELKGKYYDAYKLSVHKILDYKSDEWWITEYKKWSKIATKLPKDNAYQASRIQNFLSASFYENCFSWIQNKEYNQAAWTASVLARMLKNKPYPYLLEAKIAALQGQYKKAEKKLTLAIKNGLTKQASILREPAFEAMKGRKGFEKLLVELEE